ncbi:Trp repressor binding protein [Vigna unguiculata]|uniref:Trp repressor binding protein n=1 Tax=Vigna unguiculata TaxID=3917 RepID=A0A4D6MVL0_VIGUN|nr:Trp repressor binding protein [Vigna unguiculata]
MKEQLAWEIEKGAASVEGVEAKLWQVPETFPEVLQKLGAPPKCDVPTSFLRPMAFCLVFLQISSIALLCMEVVKKLPRESLNSSLIPLFLFLYVDIYYSTRSPWNDLCAVGYTFGAGIFELEKLKGGSPYGSGTYAGDGSRQPI